MSYGNRAHNTEMLSKHELYFSPDESIYSSWSDEDIVQLYHGYMTSQRETDENGQGGMLKGYGTHVYGKHLNAVIRHVMGSL